MRFINRWFDVYKTRFVIYLIMISTVNVRYPLCSLIMITVLLFACAFIRSLLLCCFSHARSQCVLSRSQYVNILRSTLMNRQYWWFGSGTNHRSDVNNCNNNRRDEIDSYTTRMFNAIQHLWLLSDTMRKWCLNFVCVRCCVVWHYNVNQGLSWSAEWCRIVSVCYVSTFANLFIDHAKM